MKRGNSTLFILEKDSLNANEEIIFDCNRLAGHDYFQLVGLMLAQITLKLYMELILSQDESIHFM